MADYKAVIAGATGATGREFVCFLLARDRCKRVTVLARDAEKAAAKLQKTAAGAVIDQAALKQKLQIVEFDYEALLSEGSDGVQAKKLAGHSVGINCLGTTKGDAGGSPICRTLPAPICAHLGLDSATPPLGSCSPR